MKKYGLWMTLAAVCLMGTACSEHESLATDGQRDAQPTQADIVRFDTYFGRGYTRGGAFGTITTDTLKKQDYGFGVFAYKTGGTAYADYRTKGDATGRYPNFMYNEPIVFDKDADKWEYKLTDTTKYWPNDYEGGGKVSFFAYGPYAKEADKATTTSIDGQPIAATDNDGTKSGIIAFSTAAYNGSSDRYSDPYVKFRLSSDSQKMVDLLWATTEGSSQSVLGSGLQMGSKASNLDEITPPNQTRPQFRVPTDLTKQLTEGTVCLLFKHALAKIGGAYIGTGDGADEDGETPTNGLMVILDIDKDGKQTGGTLRPYTGGTGVAGTPYNTKVTINSITLENERQLTSAGLAALNAGTAFDYSSSTYTQEVSNTAILNLATGVWSDMTYVAEAGGTATPRSLTILPAGSTTGSQQEGTLTKAIAEPTSFTTTAYTQQRFEELPIGVTTVAKNVFQDEAQPFIFIPGTLPVVNITIDYTVRTYDAKLANNYTEVRQQISKRLYMLKAVEMNKQYNILMHIGLTSVKFTATVDDWTLTSGSASSGGTTPVPLADEDIEHIYLPANVEGTAPSTPARTK